MSRLKPRIKHVSLAFMGEEWAESYLEFKALSWADVSKLNTDNKNDTEATAKLYDTIKGAFLSGKGIGEDGSAIDLTADDIDDLDLETIAEVTKHLSGQPDPNA